MHFKSPYPGIVALPDLEEGEIKHNINLFNVINEEYEAKKNLVEKKIKIEYNKKKQLQNTYHEERRAWEAGYISEDDLRETEEKINALDISLDSLNIEKNNTETLLRLASPLIPSYFIVRNIVVSNGQYVNAGDDLADIELLDSFLIDIKIDPVSLSGNIRKKKIMYTSLVNGLSGMASVARITRTSENGQNDKGSGLRVITLITEGEREKLTDLLDTAFRIDIYD
ncbi:TPA: HlyD family secretion protein [Escherichia coli]|nr:HlyD family secretion protein [Escherichia coli]